MHLSIACEELDAPEFGSIDCSLGEGGVPLPGSTCDYSCDDGYNIGETTSVTCGDDGVWRPGRAVECVKGKCVVYSSLLT